MALRTDLAPEPETASLTTPAVPLDIVLPDVPEVGAPEISAPTATARKVVTDVRSLSRLAGTWVPNSEACRRGADASVLPLVMTAKDAKAGSAICRFGQAKGDGSHWNVVAKCSNGGERWTANVRLVLANARLTWTSERGTQTYGRCGAKVASRQR